MQCEDALALFGRCLSTSSALTSFAAAANGEAVVIALEIRFWGPECGTARKAAV